MKSTASDQENALHPLSGGSMFLRPELTQRIILKEGNGFKKFS
jgi:hypothetical protein